MEKKIAKALLSIHAVFLRTDDPFTWASGIKSPIYCDNRLTLTAPAVRTEIENGLCELIRKHYHYTGSHLAGLMLDNWNKYVDEFIQVVPIEYKKVLQEEQMRKLQEKIAEMQRDY